MRRRVAVFPKYSLAERRQMAVDVVRSSSWAESPFRWYDDRLCPMTGNAPMMRTEELKYPDEIMATIEAEAIGSVAPVSTPRFRATVDAILAEGGIDVSTRESLDCEIASAKKVRDEWCASPLAPCMYR
eukprot:SAG31_NODE_20487_length_573_cov_0.763713_2_plen_129_part_00